jgi:hypothetical protein
LYCSSTQLPCSNIYISFKSKHRLLLNKYIEIISYGSIFGNIYFSTRSTAYSKRRLSFSTGQRRTAKKIWRCENYGKDPMCSTRIHTTNSAENPELLLEISVHNHGPNPVKCDVKDLVSSIKARATSDNSPSDIVKSSMLCQNIVKEQRLCLETSKEGFDVQEGQPKGILPLLTDIVLPEPYQLTHRNKPFLFHDSHSGADQFLIFTTKKNLRFLQYCDTWLVDGTFKACPVLFDQLFVIHGHRGTSTFPLIYMLLPRRDTSTYRRALTEVQQKYPGLAPRVIMSDFELASINAFHEKFPEAEQKVAIFISRSPSSDRYNSTLGYLNYTVLTPNVP